MESQNSSENSNIRGKIFRLLRPSIVVLCGPAACGKSTFAQLHFRPTQIISSDWARAHVCDDERDQRFNVQAFALVHFIVEQRLMANRLCVVDSTALTFQARKDLLELARKYQVPTTLMLFNAPLETCIERDEKRERTVGRLIIERHYRAFEQTRATLGQEGFHHVVEIPDGDQEKIQIEILFRPIMRPGQRPAGEVNRRFENSGQSSRPRPSRPGGNGHSPVTSAPIAMPRALPQHPAPSTSSISTAKVAAPLTSTSGKMAASAATPPVPAAAQAVPAKTQLVAPSGALPKSDLDKSAKMSV